LGRGQLHPAGSVRRATSLLGHGGARPGTGRANFQIIYDLLNAFHIANQLQGSCHLVIASDTAIEPYGLTLDLDANAVVAKHSTLAQRAANLVGSHLVFLLAGRQWHSGE
jgi:hypothetical protein